jgi:hypothetical protein
MYQLLHLDKENQEYYQLLHVDKDDKEDMEEEDKNNIKRPISHTRLVCFTRIG